MTAERLMLLGGVTAFVLTIYWVRGRKLREKYAVAWTVVASLLLLCGLFPEAIEDFAAASHLGYASAVLFVALGAIYLFAFSVSVSLTSQYRRTMSLNQEIALLEARVRELEAALGKPPPTDVRPGRADAGDSEG
jgi:hypothetical protein